MQVKPKLLTNGLEYGKLRISKRNFPFNKFNKKGNGIFKYYHN